MSEQTIHHPIQQTLDEIWKSGHTPRLQVDARRTDVVVPEHVRARWGSRLVLDLDASYPLELEYSAQGIHVDLAFQGTVTRCTLPWQAIYVVLDRSTGRGIAIERHAPKDDAPEAAPPARPALAPVPSRPEPPGKDPAKDKEPGPAVSDDDAKARRARFRVITGGSD